MKPYDSLNHSKYRIRYHLIFSTKYRKDCLVGIEGRLSETIHDIAKASRFSVLHVGIDRNHVHLLVRSSPSQSPKSIVSRLKQMTTHRLWRDCPDHLAKFYWGRKRLLWSNGYFVGTVGEVSEAVVEEYIRKQG